MGTDDSIFGEEVIEEWQIPSNEEPTLICLICVMKNPLTVSGMSEIVEILEQDVETAPIHYVNA